MSSATPVLTCSACGHQNEPERVYCHNCGQKLDRSLLPKPQETPAESNLAKRRRVQKMMRPGKGAVMRDLKTLVSVLFFAALVAAVFLFFQTPEGIPDKKGDLPDRNAGEVWEAMTANRAALNTVLTEPEVNTFLSRALKKAESSVPGVTFERAFVNFMPGAIRVTVERSAWGGLMIYSSTTYAPRVVDGGVVFEPVAVYFGRLGVHPSIPYAPGLGLGGVGKALEKELAKLPRLARAEPGAQTLRIVTKPQP